MTSALEIIRLRFPAGSPERLIEDIHKSILTEGHPAEVTVYMQVGVARDISIHLHHRGDDTGALPSELGVSLGAALKAHGMIEHTIWKEEK